MVFHVIGIHQQINVSINKNKIMMNVKIYITHQEIKEHVWMLKEQVNYVNLRISLVKHLLKLMVIIV